MTRRLFSRGAASGEAAVGVDSNAHGCPACPHPPVFREADSDGDASTLLPLNRMALDGERLQIEVAAGDFAEGTDELDSIEIELD